VLQSLTATFQYLLSHSQWLVHHHAMEAFRMFAEVQATLVMADTVPVSVVSQEIGAGTVLSLAPPPCISCVTHTQVTPYADAVEQCIPSTMQDTVINFLNKVPHHSHEFSQQAWLLQCLEERERLVREWRRAEAVGESATREDAKQCNGQLPMQNSGASEQVCV